MNKLLKRCGLRALIQISQRGLNNLNILCAAFLRVFKIILCLFFCINSIGMLHLGTARTILRSWTVYRE